MRNEEKIVCHRLMMDVEKRSYVLRGSQTMHDGCNKKNSCA